MAYEFSIGSRSLSEDGAAVLNHDGEPATGYAGEAASPHLPVGQYRIMGLWHTRTLKDAIHIALCNDQGEIPPFDQRTPEQARLYVLQNVADPIDGDRGAILLEPDVIASILAGLMGKDRIFRVVA